MGTASWFSRIAARAAIRAWLKSAICLCLPKLLRNGVNDMVRISDARMSGTAYGTVVLHISPEAAAGGPLALVHSGDMIALDVAERVLSLDVDESTLAARRAQWTVPPLPERGWLRLYVKHVMQAHQGADLDFLVGNSGAEVPRTHIEKDCVWLGSTDERIHQRGTLLLRVSARPQSPLPHLRSSETPWHQQHHTLATGFGTRRSHP